MSNRHVVQRVYDASVKRDVQTVLAFLDPMVEWGQPETLSWGGTYRGPREVLECFAKVNEHVEALRVDADEYLDAEGSVVVLGWVRGRSRRGGTPFAVRLAHMWKLRDATVVWFYSFVDTAALLAATEGDARRGNQGARTAPT